VENRRIGKSTNGTQIWFAYDGQNTFADFNSGGSLTNRYLYGNAIDQLFAKYASATATWYLTDMLGSVRQLANTSGTILDTLTYDSFGNVLSETSPSNGDRFKFTAREWDSEIGLQFNRARYYSPVSGRWESDDPIAFRGGDPNLYRYVDNAPNCRVDPTGLTWWETIYDDFSIYEWPSGMYLGNIRITWPGDCKTEGPQPATVTNSGANFSLTLKGVNVGYGWGSSATVVGNLVEDSDCIGGKRFVYYVTLMYQPVYGLAWTKPQVFRWQHRCLCKFWATELKGPPKWR
jgi:RHS repeat-associated protein